MTDRQNWYDRYETAGRSGRVASQWEGSLPATDEFCYGCEHCTHADRVGDEDCYGYCDACAAELAETAGLIREGWELGLATYEKKD